MQPKNNRTLISYREPEFPLLILYSHSPKYPGGEDAGPLVQDLQLAIWFRSEVGFIEMVNPDETIFSAGSVTRAGGRHSNTV